MQHFTAGYKLLFGDLPLRKVEPMAKVGPGVVDSHRRPAAIAAKGGRNAGQRVRNPLRGPLRRRRLAPIPRADAERLLRVLPQARAYRRPSSSANEARRFPRPLR